MKERYCLDDKIVYYIDRNIAILNTFWQHCNWDMMRLQLYQHLISYNPP